MSEILLRTVVLEESPGGSDIYSLCENLLLQNL